tara:strand:+ start:262 stop:447 length:186 start_codon:yes stop_codon:yes gene_type:complete
MIDKLLEESIKIRAIIRGRPPTEDEIAEMKEAMKILIQVGGSAAVEASLRMIEAENQKEQG